MSITVSDADKGKIVQQITSFINAELFQVGHADLSENEELLFSNLKRLKHLLTENNEIPPLLLLEIFLLTHGTKHPPIPFILDWLYEGALEFHQAEGQYPFERGLGFTAGRGAESGQGHEFKSARRINFVQRGRLFFWIGCLNKFEGYTVEDAVNIVHLLHERQSPESKRRTRQPIGPETLLREYKAWKGKGVFNDEDITESWERKRPEWQSLFQSLKQESVTLPTPSKQVKPIR